MYLKISTSLKKDMLVSLSWALGAIVLTALLRSLWSMGGLDWITALASAGAVAGSAVFQYRRETVLIRRFGDKLTPFAAFAVAIVAACAISLPGLYGVAVAIVAAAVAAAAASAVLAAVVVIHGGSVAVALIYKETGDIGLAVTTVSATFTATCALIGLIYAWRADVLVHRDRQTKRTEAITRAVVAEAVTEAVEPISQKLDRLMDAYRNADDDKAKIIADLTAIARDLGQRAHDGLAYRQLQDVLNSLAQTDADMGTVADDLRTTKARPS